MPRPLVDVVEIKDMINTDKVGLKRADRDGDGRNHIDVFFAALSQVTPKKGGVSGNYLGSIDKDMGGSRGGEVTPVKDFFDKKDQKREGNKK